METLYDYINHTLGMNRKIHDEPYYIMNRARRFLSAHGIHFTESAWDKDWMACSLSYGTLVIQEATSRNGRSLAVGFAYNFFLFLDKERPLVCTRNPITHTEGSQAMNELRERAKDVFRCQIDMLRNFDYSVMYTGKLGDTRTKSCVKLGELIKATNERVIKLASVEVPVRFERT